MIGLKPGGNRFRVIVGAVGKFGALALVANTVFFSFLKLIREEICKSYSFISIN